MFVDIKKILRLVLLGYALDVELWCTCVRASAALVNLDKKKYELKDKLKGLEYWERFRRCIIDRKKAECETIAYNVCDELKEIVYSVAHILNEMRLMTDSCVNLRAHMCPDCDGFRPVARKYLRQIAKIKKEYGKYLEMYRACELRVTYLCTQFHYAVNGRVVR